VFHQFVDISEIRVTQKSIYLCIHKNGPISKNDIQENLGSSLANIGRFLLELEDTGMILKSKSRGRLSGKYKANPDAGYAFGGYINSDVIGLGLCDVAGNIVNKFEIPFADADTPEKALDFFSDAHMKLTVCTESEKALGSSIAIMGPMDKDLNLIVNPPNMPKWGMVPFKKMYEDKVTGPMTPVLFAEAILLGSLFFDVHDLNENINLFWLDEGIGAGISHRGRMGLDLKDNSKILGHQIVDFNGLPCHCGQRGCLINYGSIQSIRQTLLPYCRINPEDRQKAEDRHLENPWCYSTDLELIKYEMERQDRSFQIESFLEDFDKAYFAGLWNTFSGINPDKVIFCGRIAMYYRDRLQNVISKIMKNYSNQKEGIDVQWVDLNSDNLIQGSAARVFNNYLNFVD